MTDKISIGPCMPLLIVSDISRSLHFYVDLLGFDCSYKYPPQNPSAVVVNRGAAQLLLSCVEDDVTALPNHTRHPKDPIDVFIYAADPKNLAQEFSDKYIPFWRTLRRDGDGLASFEVSDPDGYVLQFGCPR